MKRGSTIFLQVVIVLIGDPIINIRGCLQSFGVPAR